MLASHTPQLVVTTCTLSSLDDAVEEVERLRVVTVGRLVDDERGGGGVEGGQFRIERGLAHALRRPACAPSTCTLRMELDNP